jgi:hypothetical protein
MTHEALYRERMTHAKSDQCSRTLLAMREDRCSAARHPREKQVLGSMCGPAAATVTDRAAGWAYYCSTLLKRADLGEPTGTHGGRSRQCARDRRRDRRDGPVSRNERA